MGYFINAQGTIEMPQSLEDEALYALKMLNHDHDAKRGGGGRTGDPFEDRWYSWMPGRYHETVGSVQEVLELLGFGVTKARKAGLNVYALVYDNKTGQEEVFLNCLARFAQVTVDATGEDGQRWRWMNAKAGSPLEYQEAVVNYKRRETVAEMIEKDKAYRAEIWRTYA